MLHKKLCITVIIPFSLVLCCSSLVHAQDSSICTVNTLIPLQPAPRIPSRAIITQDPASGLILSTAPAPQRPVAAPAQASPKAPPPQMVAGQPGGETELDAPTIAVPAEAIPNAIPPQTPVATEASAGTQPVPAPEASSPSEVIVTPEAAEAPAAGTPAMGTLAAETPTVTGTPSGTGTPSPGPVPPEPPSPPTTVASSSDEVANPGGTIAGGSTGEESGEGMIRPLPAALPTASRMRPFSTVAIALKADTLGAGFDIATPLSSNFNLRTSMNFLGFGYPFNLDGLNYDADIHFRSSQVTLDWFPVHGDFHISPGILYIKTNLASTANVPAGQTFQLASQTFTNSVDDPINGSASIVYPHSYAPSLMVGFTNIIPRSGGHFSMPYEFGIAYTGAPHVNMTLSGTACTDQGCFDVNKSPEMQQNLSQEIAKLNEDLKSLPFYPIVSIGFAYRF